MQGGDNGTGLQKDEPQAPNPPDGAFIDYYLKANATGAVTVEILDATGAVVRTFTAPTESNPAPAAGGRGGGGGIPNASPLWRTTPEPFSTAAGMHRVIFNPVVVAVGAAAAVAAEGVADVVLPAHQQLRRRPPVRSRRN